MANSPKLGDVASSEQLIRELYLDLRRRTRQWASITMQTAQARMGYIGQHLVSVATGLPGGRSGARGHDLLHKDGTPGEIKTCYRVDQLGKCNECREGVAPDEVECSACGSTEIDRKEDSKWLISLRNDTEYSEILSPSLYYLVLFEFTDLANPDTIRASIWTVEPEVPGFLLCMVDYYHNIRAKSKSKAPFNFWPYSLKFELMRPALIYQSLIGADDSIDTVVFPGRDAAIHHPLSDFAVHARTKMDDSAWISAAHRLGAVGVSGRKVAMAYLEKLRRSGTPGDEEICRVLAQESYGPRVASFLEEIPGKLRPWVEEALKGRAGES